MSQLNYESEVREQRARGFNDHGNNGKLSPKKKAIAKKMKSHTIFGSPFMRAMEKAGYPKRGM